MKRLIIFLTAILPLSCFQPELIEKEPQADYFVSVSGDDNNTGTIDEPFATINKLNSVMKIGNKAYIRGGTYKFYGNSKGKHVDLHDMENCTIENYPGEIVILDFSEITLTKSYCFAVRLYSMTNFRFKGIKVTGLKQQSFQTIFGISAGGNDVTVENCEVYNMGGFGFFVDDNSMNITFRNCDAHHCVDPLTDPAYENADGFRCSGKNSTNIVYEGCRSWKNSDDGWDFWTFDGTATVKNCWSFQNGYDDDLNELGNGNGIKLGRNNTSIAGSTIRYVEDCMAAGNKGHGFDQNVCWGNSLLKNNIAIRNVGTGFAFFYHQELVNKFYDNISFNNSVDFQNNSFDDNDVEERNSWQDPVKLNENFFKSLNIKELENERKTDGSLPDVSFGQTR